MFRCLPGQKKVELLEYKLHGEGNSSEIGEDEWESVVIPGVTLAMSILLHAITSTGSQTCPKCQTLSCGPSGPSHIIQCRLCQLQYEFIDRERVVELQDVKASDLESPIETEPKGPSAVEGERTKKSKRTDTEKEENAFRRISYVRETLINTAGRLSSPALRLRSLNGIFERKTISVPFFPDALRIGRQFNEASLPTPFNG